ncbi:hypothetical protein VPH35_130170 [Triticum aestivum]
MHGSKTYVKEWELDTASLTSRLKANKHQLVDNVVKLIVLHHVQSFVWSALPFGGVDNGVNLYILGGSTYLFLVTWLNLFRFLKTFLSSLVLMSCSACYKMYGHMIS